MKSNKKHAELASQRMKKAHKHADRAIMYLDNFYQNTNKNLTNEITKLIDRAENVNATEFLNETMTNTEYNKLLELYKTTKNTEVKKEIERRIKGQTLKYRITRKEAIRNALERDRLKRTDTTIDTLKRSLTHVFKENTKQNAKDYDFRFSEIPEKRVSAILGDKFAGRTFSACIWNDQDELKKRMQELIFRQVSTGSQIQKLKNELSDLTTYNSYVANRILRTETTRIVNESDLLQAKERGVKYRKYFAHLDGRTSGICKEHNGKIIRIEDTVIGENTPPLHPNCRSVMIDLVEGLDYVDEKELKIEEKDTHDLQVATIDSMAKGNLFKEDGFQVRAGIIDKKNNIYIPPTKTKAQRDTLLAIQGFYKQLPEEFSIPVKTIIVPSKQLPGYAGYSQVNDFMYISDNLLDEKVMNSIISSNDFPAKNFEDVLIHEFTHKKHWDEVKRLYNSNKKAYNNIIDAKQDLEAKLKTYVKNAKLQEPNYISKYVSDNADHKFGEEIFEMSNSELNEFIADGYLKIKQKTLNDKYLDKLIKEVLGL